MSIRDKVAIIGVGCSKFGIHYDKGPRELIVEAVYEAYKDAGIEPKEIQAAWVGTLSSGITGSLLAEPVGLFDCCPTTDGAAAVIIVKKELARKFRDDPVYLKGIGIAIARGGTSLLFNQDFEFLGFPATRMAAGQAYQQAGVADPLKEISLAEVHDCFTITEIVNYEDLGFCQKGEGGEFISGGPPPSRGSCRSTPAAA